MDATPYSAVAVDVLRLPAGATERDLVAVEEPPEIRIGGLPVAVTMRMPGHDEELALGFCLSEGLVPREARLPEDLAANAVEVDAPRFDPSRLQRSFYTSSSCGVCGKGALEAVAVEAPRVESELRLPASLVASLPDRLREAQAAFEPPADCTRRGSSPRPASWCACARTSDGTTRWTRSSAGRSASGCCRSPTRAVRERPALVRARPEGRRRRVAATRRGRRPLESRGRSRGRRGVTLCGFVRGGSFNVYTEPWRIGG